METGPPSRCKKHMSRIRVTLWQGLRRVMGYDGTAAAPPEGVLNSTSWSLPLPLIDGTYGKPQQPEVALPLPRVASAAGVAQQHRPQGTRILGRHHRIYRI